MTRHNYGRTSLIAPLLLGLLFLAGCTPSIHDAVGRAELDTVRALIDADAGAVNARNQHGKTPLHYAVSYKQIPAMELLLEQGADINAQDITGMTPLHVAAMYGRKDEAAWLLEHGADPTLRDKFGDTPMHTTAVFGTGALFSLLRDAGLTFADTNAAGKTPLQLAREYRQEKVVAYLERQSAP